jgi:hypothetical protein
LIFLGAGASVPFAIPTMNGFTDKVAESLSSINKDWENKILEIKSRLQSKGLRYDIEILSTALSIFSDLSASKTYLAPFFAFSDNPIPAVNPALAALLTEVKEQIYKICKRYNRSEANRIYESLFNSLHNVGSTKINSDGNLETFLYPVGCEVFTTNYDLSFNKYLEYKQRDYADGFSGADKGGISAFTDTWSERNEMNLTINFGKLHGSINYYKQEEGRIVKYPTSLDEEDMNSERIIDNMMIYPIGEKYTTITPYFEILSRFRNTLINEKVVIVIGYSFRDDPINNAFVDRAIRHRKSFKIILVDPVANDIIGHMPNVLQPLVTPVETEFGSENSFNLIVSAIQDRHPGDTYTRHRQ